MYLYQTKSFFFFTKERLQLLGIVRNSKQNYFKLTLGKFLFSKCKNSFEPWIAQLWAKTSFSTITLSILNHYPVNSQPKNTQKIHLCGEWLVLGLRLKKKLSKLHFMISLQQLDLNERDPWNLRVDSKTR